MLKNLQQLIFTSALIALVLMPFQASAQVNIKLSLVPDQGLRVEYSLPPNCPVLRFEKDGPGAALIRRAWKGDDSCLQVDGDFLRSTNSSCRVAEFTVPASVNKVTGYPAAAPMGDAIYLHTSNYQVDDRCGAISYEFVAPYVAYEGHLVKTQARTTIAGDYTFPALLSPSALTVEQGVISYFDPSIASASQARIKDVSEKTIDYLKSVMPKAQFMMPIIATANVKHPGDMGFDGDAGNVLRLSLFNWPEELTPYAKTTLTNFVAHEFSHRFQKRDEVDIYPISRVIHEGGGEFLRWYTSIQMGWLNHQEAAQDLDDALSRCLLGTDGHSWQSLSSQFIGTRQLAYRCGLAAYVYGLATRQNHASAIANFGDFYERIQQGERPDFYDAIECGQAIDCHPTWLSQLFSGQKSVQSVWQDFFQKSQLAKQIAPNQTQVNLMLKKAFSLLMRDDCGESSVFEASDGLIIDDIKTCRTLKKGMKITGVEGYSLFGNRQALPALTAACKTKHRANLQVANADSVEVACHSSYEAPQHFYAVDIEKLLRNLK